MPLKTRFTELTGVEHPIMQGGMHHVGYAEMAAAVSNAGGLGCITALSHKTPEELRAAIKKCKSLTSKPFAVNVTLLPILTPPDYPAYVQVIIDEGVKVIETAGRSPDKFVKLFKAAGCVVIHKCTSIRHALSAQKSGVDMVSMDGFEAGGHPGEDDVTNWVLFARAARALKIPYIASGACGDGKQLAAALALGCEGMNCGTRFMATKEAPIKDDIKKALVEGSELSTTLVMRTLKNTERVYKNVVAVKVQEQEAQFPGEIAKIIDLVKGDNYYKSFHVSGDSTSSVWSCGQVIGLIEDIPTCEKLIADIVAEAEGIITGRLQSLVKARL